ncbi:MAG: hypothetical protein WAO01_20970 [Bradyrhizobium sp.]
MAEFGQIFRRKVCGTRKVIKHAGETDRDRGRRLARSRPGTAAAEVREQLVAIRASGVECVFECSNVGFKLLDFREQGSHILDRCSVFGPGERCFQPSDAL